MYRKSFKQIALIGLTLILLLLVIALGRRAGATEGIETGKNSQIQVDAQLLAEMRSEGQAPYLIYFDRKADLSPAYSMDWEARGHFVVDALRAAAEASQRNVRAFLDGEGVAYQHFWVDNVIVVESSDLSVLNGLMNRPEIAQIRADADNYLIEPEQPSQQESVASILAAEPNLVRVKARDVWALGFRGQGIVLANIDSGVRYTHDALSDQYRGISSGSNAYNWLDPAGGSPSPIDTNGHGTHVMGTMVGYDGGANEIGVAPEAEWIACRACAGIGCSTTALLACGQWIVAPYDMSNPGSVAPNMRPHVVNNSWGGCNTTYDPWYQGVVDAWLAAGVYPVFAAGNASGCGYSSPPGLNTAAVPARYGNVTAVGSSGTNNGLYAPHSNWGPTDHADTVNPQPGFATMKPQVIAPGVNIRSSVHTSDAAYASTNWTGTSMSAPHVTGMIALMWQAAGCLVGDYATTETIIEQTATPVPYNSGGTPPPGPGNVPNYASGWGEIDILAAVQAAQAVCEASGQIIGTVQSSGYCDANPFLVAGAEVVVSSSANSWTTYTGADGLYSLFLDESHSPVAINVTAADQTSVSATGVTITSQMTTTVNFQTDWIQPCVSVAPDAYVLEVVLGAVVTDTLLIHNQGLGATSFSFTNLAVEGNAPAAIMWLSDEEPPPTVDWLAQQPANGAIGPDSSQAVDVIFNSSVLTQTGVYHAVIQVATNDPVSPTNNVPVTMTVVPAAYGADLSPATAALSGAPGDVVTYELNVTNNGNVADSFSFSAAGGAWAVGLPADVTLGAGDSTTVAVSVAIPATAAGGDDDTVTITATSAGDGTATASSTLTTTAGTQSFHFYLPAIARP